MNRQAPMIATMVNGKTFTRRFSNHDAWDNLQQVVQTVTCTTNYTYSQRCEKVVRGVLKDETVVGKWGWCCAYL